MSGALAATLLVGATLIPETEDDLTVVRRALGAKTVQAAPETTPKAAAPPARKAEKAPQWLRVRVVEKTSKNAKVSINLPLALVRALGEECPLDWCRTRFAKGGACRPIRLSEMLEALDSGRELVEIEDENATIRVWVE